METKDWQVEYTYKEFKSLHKYVYKKNVFSSIVIALGVDFYCEIFLKKKDEKRLNKIMRERFRSVSIFDTYVCYKALFNTSYEDLPTLISYPNDYVRQIVSWRLHIGK